MAAPLATPALNLGFLTVVREANGYLGGYLVTNQWGRPLEFRLSTPVQPNRVQQILYAETLEPYVCGELIGKTLVEKTGVPVWVVVTDTPAALDLRQRLEMPVVLLANPSASAMGPATTRPRSLSIAALSSDSSQEAKVRSASVATLELNSALDHSDSNSGPHSRLFVPRTKAEQSLRGHPRFPDDATAIRDLLDKVYEGLDLAEPFQRIREAMAEARKMGVTNRA